MFSILTLIALCITAIGADNSYQTATKMQSIWIQRTEQNSITLDTCLLESAQYDDKEAFEYALTHGANPNAQDEGGNTPLMYAIKKSNLAHMKELLAHQADVSLKNTDGTSPLIWSLFYLNAPALALLLKNGARADEQNLINGNTLLHAAAGGWAIACVKALMYHQPSLLQLRNNKGNTPLHESILSMETNQYELAEEKVTDYQSASTKLMLLYAHQKGVLPHVITLKNNAQETPKDIASKLNTHKSFINFLEQCEHGDTTIFDSVIKLDQEMEQSLAQ